MILMTIGYEGLDIDTFLAELKTHRVEKIVDVRELPLSRKRGFSKTALAAQVELAGITYVHMSSLGCPRNIRRDYYADKDWGRYKKRFNAYLQTQGEELETLRATAAQQNCCLVCFEADYQVCHRSLITEALARRGRIKIKHLPVKSPAASAGPEPVFA